MICCDVCSLFATNMPSPHPPYLLLYPTVDLDVSRPPPEPPDPPEPPPEPPDLVLHIYFTLPFFVSLLMPHCSMLSTLHSTATRHYNFVFSSTYSHLIFFGPQIHIWRPWGPVAFKYGENLDFPSFLLPTLWVFVAALWYLAPCFVVE